MSSQPVWPNEEPPTQRYYQPVPPPQPARDQRNLTPPPPPPAPPSQSPQPVPPSPKKRSGFRTGCMALVFLAIVVVIIAIANGGGSGSSSGSGGNPAAPAQSSQVPTPPKTYTGTGDDVVSISKPSGPAIVVFECPHCSENTILQSDGAESLLVNTIGPYSGKRWIDVRDGSNTSKLTVKATGSWKITVGGLDLATHANGPVSGHGDDVIVLAGSTSTATVTNKNGSGNFIVENISDSSGTNLPINTIGGYSGTVPLQAPSLVQVTSDGDWTITPKP